MTPVEDHNKRGSSWPLYILGALLAAGVLLLAAWNIHIPYLAFSPGPVSDAADAVIAEDVEVFPPEGELLMLTVVSQDVNIFEAIVVGLDPTLDLVRRERFRPPDESDEEYRERVLQQMDDSQFRSIVVAMDYLGYEMVPTDVHVTSVREDLPAADVLEPGDIIETVNGVVVDDLEDLSTVLDGSEPGDLVTMEVDRGGSTETVEVELVGREDELGGAMIGISVELLMAPPFPISLDTGVVGGPSAGMMHTLAIIDSLTEGELTAGYVVAGTGTIRADGTVGNIGGVRQKVVGAEAAGARYLLVPEGNYEEALTAERDSIEIIPIAHVDDAIEFLESLDAANY